MNKALFPVSHQSKPAARISCPPEGERAAGILAACIQEMSGASLPVNLQQETASLPVHLQQETASPPVNLQQEKAGLPVIQFILSHTHGRDGFSYRVDASHPPAPTLLIEASRAQSFVYAVYDLLEHAAGCRWFTASESFLPHHPDLMLAVAERTCVPTLQYREVFYRDYADADFAE